MLHGAVVIVLLPLVAITSYWLAKRFWTTVCLGISKLTNRPRFRNDPAIPQCTAASWVVTTISVTTLLYHIGWIELSWRFLLGAILVPVAIIIALFVLVVWVISEEERRCGLYDDEGINVGIF